MRRLIPILLITLTLAAVAGAGGTPSVEWDPYPFRVRNLTFPTVLVMSFQPAPAIELEAGTWVVELNYSASNNFQMSDNLKTHFAESERPRGPIRAAEVDGILDAVEGDLFLIDGEFGLFDVGIHHALTDHLRIGLRLSYLTYGGGYLDGAIWDFHDSVGFGQMGREYVADDHFQLLLSTGDEEALVSLDRPSSGGFADPVVSLAWALPWEVRGWRFGLEASVKVPVANEEKFLSSGGFDVGAQLTAQRTWQRDSLIVNFSMVLPGDFEPSGSFEPATLPSVNVAWGHRLGSRTTSILQLLFSENIFRDLTDSDLSELEYQLTAGLRWRIGNGDLGLAVTENLFNFNNTPDVALHLSYGRVF